MASQENEQPLIEHLSELRTRLLISIIAIIIGSSVSFFFYDQIFAFFSKPFEALGQVQSDMLYVNHIYEGFLIKLKLSIIAGIALSLPVHLFGIIRFVFPALTKKEKIVIAVSLLAAALLSVLGFTYGYRYILPLSISFLTSSGFIPDGVGMLLSFDKNIFYGLQLLLGAIIIFQLPIILEILMVMNLLSRKQVLKSSRFVILGTFILSALFTPPDIISQIAVALPLIVLYFIALLIAYIFKFGNGETEYAEPGAE